MTPREIRDWLDEIWKILVDLNISINNAKRLAETKYDNEEQIKKHGFIQHHLYQLRFIIVIQLTKLISENKQTHKRNFFHFCNKLESTQFNNEFFKNLKELQPERYFEVDTSEQVIRETISLIRQSLFDNQLIIKKIIDARNQTYAHNDSIPGKTVPSLKNLEAIILLCNSIYNRISGTFFKSHTMFEHTGDWSIDFILRELSKMRTERLARINKKMN